MGNSKKGSLNEATNNPQNSNLRRTVTPLFNSNNVPGKSVSYNNNHKNHFLYSTAIISIGVQTDIPYYKPKDLFHQKNMGHLSGKAEQEQKLLKTYRAFESKSDKREHYLKLLKK